MTPHHVTSPPLSGPPTGASVDLEALLARVVERDGALMHTPRGITRKARRTREAVEGIEMRVETSFLSRMDEEAAGLDEISLMDRAAIGLVVAGDRAATPRDILVRRGDHVPSQYVVSLQRVALSDDAQDARVHVDDAATSFSSAFAPHALPIGVYASMSSDLSHGDLDPRLLAEQFTPADFEEAFNRVYGRFDAITSTLGEAFAIVSGWFHRVEHVERRVVEEAAEDVGAALDLVEVPRFSFARAAAGFAAVALVVTLPANAISFYRSAAEKKDVALQLSAQALDQAKNAGSAGSIGASAEALKQASARFREADETLGSANALAIGIASALPDKYRAARAMLEAGEKTSEAAGLLATGLDKVFGESGRQLDERLDVLGAYARSALALIGDASKAVATVDASSVPEAEREHFTTLRTALETGNQALLDFSSLADTLATIVGKDGLRTYLVIFQNQTELRPTGGFMGSFAEVTLDQGKVVNITVPGGGTYDLKGELKARVIPPKPLQLVNALWQFQDANWDPDFPSSADKLRWFWSKSGQPTVDGVIAVNASIMQKLLTVTGPIDMPEYGKTITADNFMIETQKAVELEYDKEENMPKKIIGDLAKRLLERTKTFQKDEWMKVAAILAGSLETKDVQAAFVRPEEEQLAERFGWNNRLKETVGDSLAVVYANIAGQKTDAVIDEAVDHHVDIAEDGSIRDTVHITREHHGVKGELFNGVRNVGYLRVYVPKGSTLVSASGFRKPEDKWFKPKDDTASPDPDVAAAEATDADGPGGATISTEHERTVFGGWVQLDPGQSQDIFLTYDLPFTAKDVLAKIKASPDATATSRGAYLLLLTSQPGKPERKITSTVQLPKDWDISWTRSSASGDIAFTGPWDRDVVLAALIHPHGQGEASK